VQQQVGQPFEVGKLTNDLRRINENPDLEVGAILSPGEKAGQTKVELAPTVDKFPFHASLFYDNLGRPNVGRQRAGVTLSHNNLLGFGDKVYASVGWAKNSFTQLMGYEIPVGARGTRFGISQAHSNYDFNIAGNSVKGHANTVNVYGKQELFRNERFIAEFESGLAIKQASFDAPGFTQTLGRDRLSVLTEVLSFQEFDRYGRTYWRNEVGIGLDMLGATTNGQSVLSRSGAGSQFSRYTTALLRSVVMPNKTYFILKGFGQATNDALSPLEQFQLGGANTVRGYREGRYLGDSGFVLSAEYRYPLAFLPEEWVVPKTKTKLKDTLELTTFADFGGVFNNTNSASTNPSSGLASANSYASGVGVGLRARLTQFMSARLDLAFPLIHLAPEQANARLHFGLESQLF
jgi:hemolysin activation/secretion protein